MVVSNSPLAAILSACRQPRCHLVRLKTFKKNEKKSHQILDPFFEDLSNWAAMDVHCRDMVGALRLYGLLVRGVAAGSVKHPYNSDPKNIGVGGLLIFGEHHSGVRN